MLSDEEKKAIEYWKTHMEILHWNTQLASEHYIKVLLDLVEKQSKEIEELKEVKWYYEISRVPKDKIKVKIEEVEIKLKDYEADKINIFSGQTYMEKFRLLGALYVLQSLLEKE